MASSELFLHIKLLLLGFFPMFGISLHVSFLPLMAMNLDNTGNLAGLAISIWFMTRILVDLPTGIMGIKIAGKKAVYLGLITSMFGIILCAFSYNIYTLIIGKGIWGFGAALYANGIINLVFDTYKINKRGKAYGIFNSVEMIGNFIGIPAGAFLASIIGYNTTFFLSSIFIFLAFLVTYFSKNLGSVDQDFKEKIEKITIKNSILKLKNKNLLIISSINLLMVFIIRGITFAIFSIYLNNHLKFSLELIGIILGIRTGGVVIGNLSSGYIINKIGKKPLLIICFLLIGSCFYLYTQQSVFLIIITLAFFDGLGGGLAYPSLIVMMSSIMPSQYRANAVGIYKTFMDIGGSLGPIIFLFLYENVSVHYPFFLASIIAFLDIIIILLFFKTSKT